MRIKTNLIISGMILFCLAGNAQSSPPKTIAAKRTTTAIILDGILDDAAWKDAPAALGYTEFRPTPFRKEDPAKRTEVYMLYNDDGIYIGGYCHERTRDSISTELNGRDGFGNNDYIGFIFDTYEDKINGFEYFITPLGEQMDAKMSPNPNGNSEDFSWNAVWKSTVKIHDDGWSFEIFLPFSSIRFSKKNIQDWGLNITRRWQKTGQQVTWNPIDPNVNGFLTQEGFWTGLENIKPPLRLQFSPYFSTYANHYPYNTPGQKNLTSSVNGGMDVKYGISQALTLDMTLIPDFGQVQSDNQVLNLTPFEVKFNENRSFFTEGTELFNKGNLFYSRRVGGMPLHYYDIGNYMNSNEHIITNPSETKLINATKISGRLQNGLGIGIFNALTDPQYAVVSDDAGNERKIQTSPLTNYNIIVLNQSLKHNSSISLVNTNVLRSGNDYDANVTAALFDFNDKTNTWNVGGNFFNSNLTGLPGEKTVSGYSHNIYFGKTSGRFNFNFNENLTNNKYNSNDLGYFTFNNFLNHSLWVGYRWIKPTSWYNNIYLNFNAFYSRQLMPAAYRNANVNINVNGQLKNLWFVGGLVGYEPKYNDFNEPRVTGRVFKGWSDYFVDGWFQTDNAKKYKMYAELLYVARNLYHSKRYLFTFNQRFRFNKKFSISQDLSMEPQRANVGFASIDTTDNDIIFGRRNRNTIENIFTFKYNFNDKMGLSTRVRHYWSKVDYNKFFTLLQDGSLADNNSFSDNINQNVNFFNIDMTYTWEFAPGSFLNIVWKNAIVDFRNQIEKDYFKNLSNTVDASQNNNLSLKVIYFLDYLQLKNHKKKNPQL
ncbi:MAG: DUF5916 domain-containing protein [Chitinophagales bacterium]